MAVVSIEFNGIKISDINNKYVLLPPIVGLAKPQIRTGEGDFSGRDGGYISTQFYGKRAVSLTGVIQGSCTEELETLRKELSDALPIRTLTTFLITLGDGGQYVLEAYVVAYQCDYDSKTFSDFKIDLLSPSPYLYYPNGEIQQDISKLISGGYPTPYSLPVQWQLGTQPSVITNTSDSVVFPEITLEGQFTNPRITNLTTGQYVELTPITTSSSDVLVIDMQRRIITLNGGSVIDKRTSTSSWWGLAIGDNTILLESFGGGDDTQGVVSYRIQSTGV